MEVVIPDLVEVARSYGEFRAVAGVGAIRNEADYDRALALIEAILGETRASPERGGCYSSVGGPTGSVDGRSA